MQTLWFCLHHSWVANCYAEYVEHAIDCCTHNEYVIQHEEDCLHDV